MDLIRWVMNWLGIGIILPINDPLMLDVIPLVQGLNITIPPAY